jgi:hypothetical protein
VPCPFCTSIILSLSSFRIQPLNIKGVLYKSALAGFALSFAFLSSLSLSYANALFLRISVSSVYIPTTLNASFVVVISKQGSYKEVTIDSLSQ